MSWMDSSYQTSHTACRSSNPSVHAPKRVFDVHLMIDEPIRYVKDFADCGADIITVHVEACKDVAATLEAIRQLGVLRNHLKSRYSGISHRTVSESGRYGTGDECRTGRGRTEIHPGIPSIKYAASKNCLMKAGFMQTSK